MDMTKMFGKLQEMQAKMQETKDQVARLSTWGESGAGLVRAQVSGTKQVLRLEIDKDLLKPEDVGVLEDLIIAAINKGIQDIEEQTNDILRRNAEGLMPDIPGFNLPKF